MSRVAAAGRSRRRWTCLNRECDWVQGHGEHKPEDGRCPTCGHSRLARRDVRTQEGCIDWEETKNCLLERGIELRGAAADEAPGAYKRLDEVLAHHRGTVKILHMLTPMGVAMAGPDIYDPFKD